MHPLGKLKVPFIVWPEAKRKDKWVERRPGGKLKCKGWGGGRYCAKLSLKK